MMSGAAPFRCVQAKLAWGLVRHRRELPKVNAFSTGACFVRLRFSRTAAVAETLPRFPVLDKSGLFSVQAKHYGFEPHALGFPEFLDQLQTRVAQLSGLELTGDIELHTFPKVLGYVFNPVSFWYFYSDSETSPKRRCSVVLCEVNNTFGERHFYLLTPPEDQPHGTLDRGALLHARKVFHVSPFFPVSGRYEFRFFNTESSTMARINYFEHDTLQLSTSVSGQLLHPSAGLWCRSLLKYGWFTLAVIVKIHWQAVKLLAKGAKFHRKPEPPTNLVS